MQRHSALPNRLAAQEYERAGFTCFFQMVTAKDITLLRFVPGKSPNLRGQWSASTTRLRL